MALEVLRSLHSDTHIIKVCLSTSRVIPIHCIETHSSDGFPRWNDKCLFAVGEVVSSTGEIGNLTPKTGPV